MGEEQLETQYFLNHDTPVVGGEGCPVSGWRCEMPKEKEIEMNVKKIGMLVLVLLMVSAFVPEAFVEILGRDFT